MCKCEGFLDYAVFALIIVGALNLGIIGLFGFNVLATVFGAFALVERVIYILVGVAALYALFRCFTHACKTS